MDQNVKHISTTGLKSVPSRDHFLKNADVWLEEKRSTDGAEGLWRVYDGLYDLTDFVDKHPGGTFWLDITEGTDITEAFESHHISTKPEYVLKKYYVRSAKTKRLSRFTFEENGFYKTLKRNVREVLETVPKTAALWTKIYTDGLLATSFMFAIAACAKWNFTFGFISGVLLAFTCIASHNYFHQKDNFRMHYADIGMFMSREWRIIHVLSHHIFTNSVADLQAYVGEPMLNIFPENKPFLVKYGSLIYTPLILWPLFLLYVFIVRMYQWIFLGYAKSVNKVDFLILTFPTVMYFFSGQSLISTIGMWIFIMAVNSFWISLFGFATVHYHPDVFLDGDTPRPVHEMDWGINQLDTCIDKTEVMGNLFLGLITFGDHAVHHLFPPMDHGVLQYLYPVILKTAKEFNLDIRVSTIGDTIIGFFKSLAKDTPNPNPPNLLKNKYL